MSGFLRLHSVRASLRSPPRPKLSSWNQIRLNSGPPQTPKPKGWSSLLRTTTLGKPASVLVLRDSEAKRGGGAVAKKDVSLEPTNVQNVNVDELLASINAQQNEPGQEDASRSIEALKPRPASPEEPLVIPAAQYEKVLRALLQSFNALQLSRYISIHEGKRIAKDKKANGKKKNPENGLRTVRSDWNIVDRTGVQKKERPATIRLKKGLAEAILRSVWQVDIQEEVDQMGIQSMQLEPAQFQVLTHGGQTSHLAELGRLHRVKLLVRKTKRAVGIHGPKYQCKRAADAIENTVGEIYEMSIGLEPLEQLAKREGGVVPSNQDIEKLALGMQCTVDFRDKGSKGRRVFVRTLSEAAANRFRRALVAAEGSPPQPRTLLLDEDWDENASVISGLGTHDTTSGPLALQPPSARFSFPSRIFPNETSPIRRRPRVIMGGDVGERALNHLRALERTAESKEQIHPSVSATYSTDFGHVKLPTDSNKLITCPISELPDYTNTDQPQFTPHSAGIPLFFLSNLAELRPTDVNLLKIGLIPSPWHQESESLAANTRYPELELCFAVHRPSRSIRFQDMTTSTSPSTAHLMLLGSTVDVQMTRRDHRTIENATLDPAIGQYVRAIEQSAAGFGAISPPPFLTLNSESRVLSAAPEPARADPEGHREMEGGEVHYFTRSIRVIQELHFPFHGFDLVYSRAGTGDNLTGARESLSLHMTDGVGTAPDHQHAAGSDGKAQQPSWESEGKTRFDGFVECTRLIVAALNRGAGDLGMMDKRPESVVRERGSPLQL